MIMMVQFLLSHFLEFSYIPEELTLIIGKKEILATICRA